MNEKAEMARYKTDLAQSGELRMRLDEVATRLLKAGTTKTDAELLAAAAQELGYDIAAADFARVLAKEQELDDDELEAVAGGWDPFDDCWANDRCTALYNTYHQTDYTGHDIWCPTVWHCWVASMHSDTEDTNVACLSDYGCIWNSNKIS